MTEKETRYIIRMQGAGERGDYFRMLAGYWQNYARRYSVLADTVLLLDTMDEAQAHLDEIAERMTSNNPDWLLAWSLSIEEYGT